VNDLANIASLSRTGIPALPLAPAENSRAQQDAFGFDLPPPQEAGENAPAAQALPVGLKGLTAEIAALLQKSEKTSDAPQALSMDDLAAKIAALLQKTGAVGGDNKIRPALISDLMGKFSLQIQDQTPIANNDLYQAITALLAKDGATPPPELTELLEKIQAENSGKDDLEKVIAQLQPQLQPQAQDQARAQNIAAPDPAILQLLKDAAAWLQTSGNGTGNSAFAKFKTELAEKLKDQGLEQPAVEFCLAALAKFLKDTPSGKPADQPDAPAVTEQPVLQQTAANIAPPVNEVSSRHIAPPAIAQNADPVNDPAKEAPQFDAPQRAADTSLPQKDESAPRLPSAAAGAPPAQPAPPQNPPAKTDAVHINTPIINMLASGNGGFDADGFSTGNNDQFQSPADGLGLLKPAGADALNTQNFTNYLTAARNLPSGATQMIAIHLQRSINAKISTMTLQLEPADLGRLDIKLKFDKEGGVKAHLSVDKPETLALLQRDSHHLEKILQQTGLDFDENSLTFDLRQQNQRHNLEGFDGSGKGNADEFSAHIDGDGAEKSLQAKIAVQANGYITQNGVNIIV
jgi:flagellar hook-length control protein FliK